MTDIREIAKRVIAGEMQEGDALALAEYVERVEEANKRELLRKLGDLEERLKVNAFLWGTEPIPDEDE